jgi:hypothetical protein
MGEEKKEYLYKKGKKEEEQEIFVQTIILLK